MSSDAPTHLSAVTLGANSAPSNASATQPHHPPARMDPVTEKVLIVLCSVGMMVAATCDSLADQSGGTLLITILAITLYRWRARKSQLLSHKRRPVSKPLPPEPRDQTPPGRPWAALYAATRDENRWDVHSSAGSLLKPAPAFSRQESPSSRRPSIPGGQQPSRSPFPPPNPVPIPSSLADRSVLFVDGRDSRTEFDGGRAATMTSDVSSAVFPIEGPGIDDDVEQGSDGWREREREEQQLARSATAAAAARGRGEAAAGGRGSAPKPSRFSWTNSAAPKTPVMTATAGMTDVSRFSVATTASSVARYRTVESWVGHQASRLEEEAIQNYLEREIEERIMAASSTSRESKGGGGGGGAQPKRGNSNFSALLYHPGTEVPLPRVSLIPSDILDSKIGPRDL